MSSDNQQPVLQEYFLKPGYIFVPEEPTSISTVIGSSVAVCIYDKSAGIAGMNHFLYPYPGEKNTTTAMYGNIAVLTLIRMMQASGARTSKLKAQVFGGAFDPQYCRRDVGAMNLKSARRALYKKNIRIVSEDVGGELGRKIVFNTTTYDIAVLKVDRLRQSDWYPYDGDR